MHTCYANLAIGFRLTKCQAEYIESDDNPTSSNVCSAPGQEAFRQVR
jgi:hypothetical protein